MELVLEKAITVKLGPTSGPREKYFARFESYFNTLEKDEKEKIRGEAPTRLNLLSAEDDVTRECFEATRTFFTNFTKEANGYQRNDYKEFAELIMVRNS